MSLLAFGAVVLGYRALLGRVRARARAAEAARAPAAPAGPMGEGELRGELTPPDFEEEKLLTLSMTRRQPRAAGGQA